MTKKFWRYQGTATIGVVRVIEFDCLIPEGADNEHARQIMLANANASPGKTKPYNEIENFSRVEVVELEDDPP